MVYTDGYGNLKTSWYEAPAPAGTKVRWDVASVGEHGVVRLKSDLGSGQAVRFDAAAGIDAGLPCAARTI